MILFFFIISCFKCLIVIIYKIYIIRHMGYICNELR